MELVIKFLLGGALVSLFSAVGSVFSPKTFAGLFGAAPPIALTSLALAFHSKGRIEVELLSRSMIIGSVALLAYSAACAMIVGRRVWVLPATILAWVAWFAVAGTLLVLVHLP